MNERFVRKCNSCPRMIAFIPTGKLRDDGKPKTMCVDECPLELKDVTIGDTVITPDGRTIRINNQADFAKIENEDELYRPHWVDCPGADQNRKRRNHTD